MVRVAILGVALAVLVGCGDGRDPRAPVTGRVTVGGEPINEGYVVFYPLDGRRQAMGAIGEGGVYSLTTYEAGDGAFLGKHRVVIDAEHMVDPGPASLEEEIEATFAVETQLERLAPVKYADPGTSPLEAEVTAGGNQLDFDIGE